MTTLHKAAQQALEALKKLVVGSDYEEAVEAEQAMDALSAALAQQAEPVEPLHEQDIEDAIEAAYWHFDARKKGLNEWASAPQSERDAFKAEARKLAKGYFPTQQAQDTKREMLAVADAFIRGKRAALAQEQAGSWQDGVLEGHLRERERWLAQEQAEPVAVSVDALAQHIRFVDGNNNLGAGILAEKIVEFLIKLSIGKEQAEPVQEPDLSRCPQCGGIADNGHDRSIPPNPYLCTKCMAEMPQPSYNVTVADDAHPNGIPLEQWQAEPVQEPVAWMSDSDVGFEKSEFGATPTVPLYTAPPQRQPLTDEEIYENGYKAGAAAEREAIMDEWFACVQSDLENGVRWLNEQAAKKWQESYPAMAGFADKIYARGETK